MKNKKLLNKLGKAFRKNEYFKEIVHNFITGVMIEGVAYDSVINGEPVMILSKEDYKTLCCVNASEILNELSN